MRTLATFAVLALFGCGSASTSGFDSGTPSPCRDTATQLCQKGAACSTGHDGGVTVFIISGVDGGLHSYGFTVNGDVTHCENFLNLNCGSSHESGFVSGCGPA